MRYISCILACLFFIYYAKAQNVGIGTTVPLGKLHIVHNSFPTPSLLIEETENDYGRMEFRNTAANSFWQVNARPSATASSAQFEIWNNSNGTYSTPLVINGTGNIGIGTASPAHTLDIRSNSSIAKAQLCLYETENDYARLKFQNSTNSNAWDIAGYTTATAGRLNFYYTGSGDVVSIISDGRVGIGTTTPQSQLDINGQIKISGGNPGAGKVLTCIDGDGFATWQNGPPKIAFNAYLTGQQLFPYNTITKVAYVIPSSPGQLNDGNAFDNATNTFTAPSSGVYHFSASLALVNPPGTYGAYIYFLVNGSIYKKGGFTNYTSSSILSNDLLVYLSAGATVSVSVSHGASGQTGNVEFSAELTSFSGNKLY